MTWWGHFWICSWLNVAGSKLPPCTASLQKTEGCLRLPTSQCLCGSCAHWRTGSPQRSPCWDSYWSGQGACQETSTALSSLREQWKNKWLEKDEWGWTHNVKPQEPLKNKSQSTLLPPCLIFKEITKTSFKPLRTRHVCLELNDTLQI